MLWIVPIHTSMMVQNGKFLCLFEKKEVRKPARNFEYPCRAHVLLPPLFSALLAIDHFIIRSGIVSETAAAI